MAGAVFLPVGIIQGIMSPISGIFGDKTNPKIPSILGVILLAASFFINTGLTYQTEHYFVMISLYLRGFGMGLLFTPLSAISMLEIPREKLAQASGLFNVIRQLGGSFGVAVLATLLTTRVNYHAQIYGAAIDVNSPAYVNVSANIKHYAMHETGSSAGAAQAMSTGAINAQVSKEAFIQGVDDDFMAAAFITIIGGLPILWLHVKRKRKIIATTDEPPLLVE
jgi:DHA2 family multidrug resistance protein